MNFIKILFSAAGVILIIMTIGFFLIVFPFIGTKKIENGTSFADGGIINVVDGISQVFIIDGGSREIGLIDAGNSSDGRPVIDALASRGFKPSDVKHIFLTHGHPDHIAAAKHFPDAKIYSLKEEIETAEGTGNNHSPISRLVRTKPTGLKVTDILKDGDVINIGKLSLEVFSIPGHTSGGAAYLVSGVLFLGDAALSSSDGRIRGAVWVFSSDIEQQNRSLKELTERLLTRKAEIKNIIFSHSGSLEGLQPLIDFTSQKDIK